MRSKVSMTFLEWRTEAERLFGGNPDAWSFECPVCGHVARTDDWRKIGKGGMAGYGCIECLHTDVEKNPVRVVHTDGTVINMFDFAEDCGK